MDKYNPDRHHRRSIRMRGYDYTQAGLYFITLCVQGRECLFGHVENNKMILNDAGQMVAKWYHELENKFGDIQCHEMVVMPNHFHCIIENVGADLRVCPKNENSLNESTQADLRVCPDNESGEGGEHAGSPQPGSPQPGSPQPGSPQRGSPLGQVVQWFKTMSTNEYIRGVKNLGLQPFNGKLWQRNYYEHIIRNEKSYQNISSYILNNPANWNADKLNHQRANWANTHVRSNEVRPNNDQQP